MADTAGRGRARHVDGVCRAGEARRPCRDHRLSEQARAITALPGLAIDGDVATLTLSGPRHNAIGRASWAALPGLIDAVAQSAARVLIVCGAGGNFAAGADIDEFDTVFADRAATLAYLDLMTAATAALAESPLPVLAAISGVCIGAGVAVALACDVRIAAPDARLAVTPAKLGLMYSLTDTGRLLAAVGASQAKDLLFTGRMIGAEEARAVGLVDQVGDAAAVAEKALVIARQSSWTHVRSKAVLGRILAGATTDDDTTRGWFADAVEGPDYAVGLAAFRGRRPPVFTAR